LQKKKESIRSLVRKTNPVLFPVLTPSIHN